MHHQISDKLIKRETGLIRPLKLELSGSQINLVSRPVVKKPCYRSDIKRPMSATPLLQYEDTDAIIRRRSPSWSRPQSADNCCSTMRRRSSKLAAKFSLLETTNSQNDSDDDDDVESGGYLGNFGATYTVSSSKLLKNLMSSSSLDDISITPSPTVTPTDTFQSLTKVSVSTSNTTMTSATTSSSGMNYDKNKINAKMTTNNFTNVSSGSKLMDSNSVISVTKTEDVRPGSSSTGLYETSDIAGRIHSKSLSTKHLEPGLASKPPLPPTPDLKLSKHYSSTLNLGDNGNGINVTKSNEEDDEIINLKFQRWFPDSVVNYITDGDNEKLETVKNSQNFDRLLTPLGATSTNTSTPELNDILSPLTGSFNDINIESLGIDRKPSSFLDLTEGYRYFTNDKKTSKTDDFNNDKFLLIDRENKQSQSKPDKKSNESKSNKSISISSPDLTMNGKSKIPQLIHSKNKIANSLTNKQINQHNFNKNTQKSNNVINQSVEEMLLQVPITSTSLENHEKCKYQKTFKDTQEEKVKEGKSNEQIQQPSDLNSDIAMFNETSNFNKCSTQDYKFDDNILTYDMDNQDLFGQREMKDILASFSISDDEDEEFKEIRRQAALYISDMNNTIKTSEKNSKEHITNRNKEVKIDESQFSLSSIPSIMITDTNKSNEKENANYSEKYKDMSKNNTENISKTTNHVENNEVTFDNTTKNVVTSNNCTEMKVKQSLIDNSKDVDNLPIDLGLNSVKQFFNSPITSSQTSSTYDFYREEDDNNYTRKLIKARLAVSSEYIIQTIKPSGNNNNNHNTNENSISNGSVRKSNDEHDNSLVLRSNSNSNIDEILSKNLTVSQKYDVPHPVDPPERDTDSAGRIVDLIPSESNKAIASDMLSSTYDDIVNILKVLEKEEQADGNNFKINLDGSSNSNKVSGINDIKQNFQISAASLITEPTIETLLSSTSSINNEASTRLAILNYLDESDRKCDSALVIKATPDTDRSLSTTVLPTVTPRTQSTHDIKTSRSSDILLLQQDSSDSSSDTINYSKNHSLAELLSIPAPELARMVVELTMQLEQKTNERSELTRQYENLNKSFEAYKLDTKAAVQRHQNFIDQLLNEKKQLADKCSAVVKEMETKHMNAIKVIEEKQKVELKRACDKTAAAEKIKRDRWVDMKTKKIKELTIKGLEPELNRMAAVHQEELAELRRAHQRQLEEAEATCNRRLAAARSQADSDKEQAVLQEREAARHRLEQEIIELEKSYQEQRRRLLAEIRAEREQISKENSLSLAEKENQLIHKLEKISQETHEKLEHQEKRYQDELQRMRGVLEAEKEAWMMRQKVEMSEKEKEFREECKRERDRHIDLAIRKLEAEASEREQLTQSKLRRDKERYEGEMKEMESVQKELRQKLKEARTEVNSFEEKNVQLTTVLNKMQTECNDLKQAIERLLNEKREIRQTVENTSKQEIEKLKHDLAQARISLREQINIIQTDKERELQQVYARVKETVFKMDETIKLVTQQRDAALNQCSQLEKMVQVYQQNRQHKVLNSRTNHYRK